MAWTTRYERKSRAYNKILETATESERDDVGKEKGGNDDSEGRESLYMLATVPIMSELHEMSRARLRKQNEN